MFLGAGLGLGFVVGLGLGLAGSWGPGWDWFLGLGWGSFLGPVLGPFSGPCLGRFLGGFSNLQSAVKCVFVSEKRTYTVCAELVYSRVFPSPEKLSNKAL